MSRIVEGETLTVEEKFTYSDGEPALPHDGRTPPEVFLIDREDNNAIIKKTYAAPSQEQKVGYWQVDVSVPYMDLEDEKELTLLWLFQTEEGEHKLISQVIVEPANFSRVTDIVTLYEEGSASEFDVVLPKPVNISTVSLMEDNKTILSMKKDDVSGFRTSRTRTYFQFTAVVEPKQLKPRTLVVKTDRGQMFTLTVWIITPQLLTTTSMIEAHINKARLQNVIPELEYTQADLVLYAYRGLNLFNQRPPNLTAFTGTNMQGFLMDCHVTCSCYYALAAQLQAEGALAFDFGGQSVSFNVDRSPAIEAALGRIETQINDQVGQAKRLLNKKGIFQGDGSVGGKAIDGSSNFGRLSLSNNALAHKRTHWGGSSYFIRNSR